MNIYVHFNVRSGRKAERLHNVASVEDHGVDSVRVLMQFSDDKHVYTDVSHVAVQPEKE